MAKAAWVRQHSIMQMVEGNEQRYGSSLLLHEIEIHVQETHTGLLTLLSGLITPTTPAGPDSFLLKRVQIFYESSKIWKGPSQMLRRNTALNFSFTSSEML
ncbi:hypothetical protein LTR17_021249 [Elasticomyces elasticus]|nr:hypothetical protein LTR17_021249 [Elasticomyces elasticus]